MYADVFVMAPAQLKRKLSHSDLVSPAVSFGIVSPCAAMRFDVSLWIPQKHISPPCGIQMQCLHIHPHYLSLSRLILKKLQALNMKKTTPRMHGQDWGQASITPIRITRIYGYHLQSHTHLLSLCPRSWIPPASASGVGKRTSIPWHQTKRPANVETSPGWNGNTTYVLSAFFKIDIVLYCNHQNIYRFTYVWLGRYKGGTVDGRNPANHCLDL